MIVFQRPYFFFFLAALFLAAISFSFPAKTMDLYLLDTYFVINFSSMLLAFSLLLFLCWGIYLAAKNILWSLPLVHLHFILTLLPMVILLFKAGFGSRTTYADLDSFKVPNQTYLIVLLGLFLAQLIMVVNIIVGIVKNLSNRR